jgi:5'-nucleotidase
MMIVEENNPKSEPIVLFDLDGTLADFDKAMSSSMSLLAATGEEPWEADRYGEDDEPSYIETRRHLIEPSYIEARRHLIKRLDGFWFRLEPMRDGFEAMRIAITLGYKIMVCSRGPRNNPKLEWCRRYLPADAQVTLTEDKGLVYGKVLVDDWPPYIERWLTWRPRGVVIMPSRRWNATFAHPQVVRYEFGLNDGVVYKALTDRLKDTSADAV